MVKEFLAQDCGDCRLLLDHLNDAERQAWKSLAGYKFQMFGYWASIWVHLNRISGARRPNPWRDLVHEARRHKEGN